MTARFGPRFGVESAFIVAVAIATFLLEVPWPGVAAAVFGAWLLVVIVEVVASRPRPEPVPGEPALPTEDAAAPPPPGLEWAERLTRYAGEPAVAEEAETRAVAPEPHEARTRPEETPTVPPGPLTEQSIAVAPVPPPAPGGLVVPARAWNLWDLERRARERAGRDPLRDEEWSFLLMYLREFADADGNLPAEFDSLVRESFAELIGAPR